MTPRRALLAALTLVAAALGPATTGAGERAHVMGAEIALLAGPTVDGRPTAGLRIALEPGWKTYWRYPGDAGIPPAFDTTGSTNLSAMAVAYPAPDRFSDGYSTSLGWHDTVVLPLKLTPERTGEAVTLTLAVDFGVCKEICVPARAVLTRRLDPAAAPPAAEAAEIAAHALRVPVPAGPDTPRLAALAVEPPATPGGKPVVRVELALPKPAEPADVVVEGPPGSALPLPMPVTGASGTFTFELDGLAAGTASSGLALRFTLRNGALAAEETRVLP